MSTTTESLADFVRERARRATEAAVTEIEGIASVTSSLGMDENSSRLAEITAELQADTFNLMVMGRFKNGKSTLVNALMGGTTHEVDLGGHAGPMVVDDLPATATLTAVHWSKDPYVRALGFDGEEIDGWSLPRYLSESTLGVDEEESQRRFSAIREFEMGFPAKLCEAGVVLYDTPGLDEHPSRTAISRQASKKCDAAIIVYTSTALLGQGDLAETSRVVAEGTRVFTIVNLWNDRPVDERLKTYVWNRYVRDQLGGPTYNGQDPASRDIYFIDAKAAHQARYLGPTDLAESSGLAAFEKDLGRFLIEDRHHARLQKQITMAQLEANAVQQQIAQRGMAARTEKDRLIEAYEQITPKLDAVRARPERLSAMFGRYRDEAQVLLRASFVELVAAIRRDLPGHLAEAELPSGQKFFATFQQNKIKHEAVEVASAFVVERLEYWSEYEVAEVLGPVVERLISEVEREVIAVDRQLSQITMELTAVGVDGAEVAPVVKRTERVLSAIAGFVFGDISAAVGGGAGGYRGAVGGIAGALGSTFLLGALGVGSVVLIPATLVAAMLASTLAAKFGLEERIKDKVAEGVDEHLRGMPEEAEPAIRGRLAQYFDDMEGQVSSELRRVIAEEERNIRSMIEINQRDQEGRDAVVAQLAQQEEELNGHVRALQQALISAQQG